MVTGTHLIFTNGKETEIKVNMLGFSLNNHQLIEIIENLPYDIPHKVSSIRINSLISY